MRPSPPRRFADLPSRSDLAVVALRPDLRAEEGAATIPQVEAEGFVAFAPGDALVHPDFAGWVFSEAARRPDVGLFYGDEAAAGSSGGIELALKPALNPALLRAQDYVGAPLIVRASVLQRLQGLRPSLGTAALYDLALRALASGVVIDRIAEVLIAHAGPRPTPEPDDLRAALEAHLAGDAFDLLPGLRPATFRVRRRFASHPDVTLLVPTRWSPGPDGRPHVARLLESLGRSTWPMDRLRVLIGDDLDRPLPEAAVRRPFAVERLSTPREPGAPFNYAAKMNALWRAAASEHVVMLNDDVEVDAPDWLEALMTFAVDEDVGGVGARLLYPDGRLQHAGMVGGPMGLFVHPWIGRPADEATYGNWALLQRDWSAVTGAVFATRRSVLEAVNGFDERFALEYNDVDLCLRIGSLGYRIVQAADAQLIHHERASRGGDPAPASQTAFFLRRWEQVIDDDPAYHPGLIRDGFVVRPVVPETAWYASAPS